MAKRLPRLDRAQLTSFQGMLAQSGISRTQQRAIMASMQVAANPLAETPEYGFASLPDARREIARQSIEATGAVFSSLSESIMIPFEEQQELNEALSEAQSEGKDRIAWALVLALLVHFQTTPEQEKTLFQAIEDAYVKAWQLAIKEQAARYGCPNARVGMPTGASLQAIQRLVKRDAESIAKTYNSQAQSTLKRLYESNPLGNVSYYLSGMSEWANTRQLQKNLSISITNVQNGYGIGLQDFVANNRIESMYRLVGAPPVCPTCSYLMGLGQVDVQTVMAYGWGLIHPNCPHRWETTNTYKIPCSSMWTGG